MRSRALSLLLLLALVGAAACTSNDSASSDEDTDSTEPTETTEAEEVPTGPSPGVTDDTIKVGITYVDLDAVREFVDLDQGDFEGSYRAVIDHVNAEGINGRTIEPVFAPVSPLGTAPAEEVCVRLTEDEDVFAVLGFFQDDAVVCPVGPHATAVVGGVMTDARFEQAEAPWFTTEAGQDSDLDALKALAEDGALDGNVGVFGSIIATDQYDTFLEELDGLGITPTAEAVLDAPQDDLTAQNQGTAVIMENFESQGVDKILAVGSAIVPLANGLAPLDYRPQLLVSSQVSVEAYTSGIDPDLSILEGAVLGSTNFQVYDEDAMQDCLAIVEEAVGPIPDPNSLEPSDPNPFVAASAACRNVHLFEAIAEAAGPDLNYGSFQAAGEELTVHLPGAEDDYEFGPYPARDGNLPMFLWDWDPAEGTFVVRDE